MMVEKFGLIEGDRLNEVAGSRKSDWRRLLIVFGDDCQVY